MHTCVVFHVLIQTNKQAVGLERLQDSFTNKKIHQHLDYF